MYKRQVREQKNDIYCQEQLSKSPNDNFITDNDGLLYLNENSNTRLVVPKTLIQSTIEQHHDTVFSGHQGIKKTIGIIKQRYYWPSLAKDIEDYISKCVSCNQSTGRRKRAYRREYGDRATAKPDSTCGCLLYTSRCV